MREFTEMDDGKWWSTEYILNDPLLYRRLVRTQIEELLTLYRHYPLPEFDSVGQILSQLQQAFSDVALITPCWLNSMIPMTTRRRHSSPLRGCLASGGPVRCQ